MPVFLHYCWRDNGHIAPRTGVNMLKICEWSAGNKGAFCRLLSSYLYYSRGIICHDSWCASKFQTRLQVETGWSMLWWSCKYKWCSQCYAIYKSINNATVLKHLSDTRWASRLNAIGAMKSSYSSVLKFLEVVEEEKGERGLYIIFQFLNTDFNKSNFIKKGTKAIGYLHNQTVWLCV